MWAIPEYIIHRDPSTYLKKREKERDKIFAEFNMQTKKSVFGRVILHQGAIFSRCQSDFVRLIYRWSYLSSTGGCDLYTMLPNIQPLLPLSTQTPHLPLHHTPSRHSYVWWLVCACVVGLRSGSHLLLWCQCLEFKRVRVIFHCNMKSK